MTTEEQREVMFRHADKAVQSLTGADVRCPACGSGLADVAPGYRFADPDTLMPTTLATTLATCTQGHRLLVTVDRDEKERRSCVIIEEVGVRKEIGDG